MQARDELERANDLALRPSYLQLRLIIAVCHVIGTESPDRC